MKELITFICFLLLIIPLGLRGQINDTISVPSELNSPKTTDTLSGDSINNTLSPSQSLADSLKLQSDLKSKVSYSAQDSIIFDVQEDMLYLYGNVEILYEEISLKAEKIRVEWGNSMVYAEAGEDSLGEPIGEPVFSEDGRDFTAEKMSYNFKTKKGRVVEGRTKEGDGFLLADVVKRSPDGTTCAADGKYTTCDLRHPHFYFQSNKLKILPNKQVITGRTHLVIEDFPVPVILPFGFFPNKTGRRNGIILPKYGDAGKRGFFLRNIGYYWGINDHFDLLLDGDIFTIGGWRLGARLRYNKLYRYRGNISVEYGLVKYGERGDPDENRTGQWFVRGSHNQTINPTTSLSGNVNIGASNFLRDQSTDDSFFETTLRSSIALTKRFPNSPFNMNISVSHSQDLAKKTMTLGLPDMSFGMARQFPFKNIGSPGTKNVDWLKKLGVSYNMQMRNSLNAVPDSQVFDLLFYASDSLPYITAGDTTPTNRRGWDFYQNGMRHTIPISTSIQLLKYININPNFSYNEYWYSKTREKFFNEDKNRVEDRDVFGFRTARDFNFRVSASTNFFGFYGPKKSARELMFRQRITPNIGYSLKPDFSEPQWNFFGEVQTDTFENTRRYSFFEGGIYGGPTQGEQQAMTFGLSNVFEMKFRKKESYKDDFAEGEDKYHRYRLLDNLSANSSYNFAADSFRLNNVSLAARTSLFKNKLSINASANLDPYAVNGEGRRIDELAYSYNESLGTIRNARVNFSTSIRPKQKKTKEVVRSQDFDKVEYREVQLYRDGYVDFSVPWSTSLNYDLSYSNSVNAIEPTVTQTLRLRGDFNFTPKWKAEFSTGYDLTDNKFTSSDVSIYRDLHCWEMSFRWIPFGIRQGYFLTINVKSATLRDLKLSRRNDWRDRF